MSAPTPRTHLSAIGIAVTIAGALASFAVMACRDLEVKYVHTLAPEVSDLKLQGVALQKEAFKHDDLLVLYGSSELVKEVPNRASEFFESYPTGFRVFPVGKAGTVSLAILQKIAAVGESIRGRKVAISLSPSFFFDETVNADYYDGNFSALQASELAFSSALSPELRRDAAKRMRLYPDTLAGNWTLDFGIERLAGDSVLDRALYAAVWPLGKLSNYVGQAQDHIEAGIQITEDDGNPDAKPKTFAGINWREVLHSASRTAKRPPSPRLTLRPKGSRDASFVASLTAADEWEDFELILRTFRELGAEPLLLSMPLHGPDLETTGVSPAARNSYGKKLASLATRYETPLVYFQEFENDPTFWADNLDHPGVKGWAHYNKVLDDFYHERPNL
jgi:D-alanine transfer protein